MLKSVITATALLAVAGGSYVNAEQSLGDFRFGDGLRAEFHYRPSAAEVSAFADARIAALKAGLQLTPDQAKNWPPFEQAVRDMVQLRPPALPGHIEVCAPVRQIRRVGDYQLVVE